MATGAWWHRVLAEARGGRHGLPGAGADQASAADGRPHPLTGTFTCPAEVLFCWCTWCTLGLGLARLAQDNTCFPRSLLAAGVLAAYIIARLAWRRRVLSPLGPACCRLTMALLSVCEVRLGADWACSVQNTAPSYACVVDLVCRESPRSVRYSNRLEARPGQGPGKESGAAGVMLWDVPGKRFLSNTCAPEQVSPRSQGSIYLSSSIHSLAFQRVASARIQSCHHAGAH